VTTEAIAAKVSTSLSGQRFIEPGHYQFTFSRTRRRRVSSLLTLTMAIQKEVGPLAAIGTFRFL